MERLIIPLGVALGIITYGMIAWWYVVPVLGSSSRDAALLPLVLSHSFRYVGLVFLVPGVVSADLPAAFALPAAYGDLLTALLALLAVVALRRQWAIAITIVWVFNLVGTVDLLNALLQGLLHIQRVGHLGAAVFIPTVIVPAYLVSHALIFWLLVKRPRV